MIEVECKLCGGIYCIDKKYQIFPKRKKKALKEGHVDYTWIKDTGGSKVPIVCPYCQSNSVFANMRK